MRNFSFKIWDKRNKKWLNPLDKTDEGYVIKRTFITLGGFIIVKTDAGLTRLPEDEYEICQYTGIRDINGLKIYEGDIIETFPNVIKTITLDDGSIYKEYPKDRRTVIEFRNGQFGYKRLNKKNDIIYFPICLSQHAIITYKGIKVIGNIYENPELLGESQ